MSYKNDVNDNSTLVPGGLQRIQTLDGYIIPLSIQDGLVHLKTHPYTDQEFETLPHVILISELKWDPSVLDHGFKEDEQKGDPPAFDTLFDEVGDFKQRVSLHHLSYFQRQDGTSDADVIDQSIFTTHISHTAIQHEDITFYDTFETEVLDAPTSYILQHHHT
jgi:hypothetical protein